MTHESQSQTCRRLVFAHPGLTAWELADISGLAYAVLERRLPDLRRKGIIKTGSNRRCRIANKLCQTWLPAVEVTSPQSPSGLDSLHHPRLDISLISPPDPEVNQLLARGPLHGWITRQMIDDAKAYWAPKYGQAVTDHDAINILQNVRRVGQVLMQIGEHSQEVDKSPLV